MTATINVNLKPCDCTRIGKYRGEYPHFATCSATPIPLPCPIPRTVGFMVTLGECDCLADDHLSHRRDCAERPIHVTCTIGGETWAESEIAWTDVAEQECSALRTANARGHAERLVRDLWKIVKALVTGKRGVDEFTPPPQCLALMAQRDAVFAALAKMATLEHEHEAARLILPASCRPIPATGSDTPHPSADALRLYVSHLIAKVSTL